MKNISFRQFLFVPALFLAVAASAAQYEWTFNDATLATIFGNGSMTYRDAATPGLTTFGTTDGTTVPHIGGQPAQYMRVPALAPANGYLLTLDDTAPNGGGSYVNQYSIVLDLYSPGAPNWQALFNTEPANSNDADFYVGADGSLGIGALGYSPAGTIAQDTWYRIGFTADLGAGTVSYYVNGTPAYTRTGGSLIDGRFALYSNADAGADVLLFNEGDASGNYTHELIVNSVYFTDRTLTAADMLALGGPNAIGIAPVPEPGTVALVGLGCLLLAAMRRRR